MGQLQKVHEDLVELGYQVVALSADSPDSVKATLNKTPYEYTLVSDASGSAAKAFGIAFRVSDEMFGKLKGYGIDLEKASGNTDHVLPVPAVFVVNDAKVAFSYVNPDYKTRLDPEVLLTAAKSAK